MKKWFPWILVAVVAVGMAWSARPKKPSAFDTRLFGELPVLLDGRIQPLDSVARNALLQLRTRQTVRVDGGEKLPAVQWLLEVLMRPEVADERKVFRID